VYNMSQIFCMGIIHLFVKNCERESRGVGTKEDSNLLVMGFLSTLK